MDVCVGPAGPGTEVLALRTGVLRGLPLSAPDMGGDLILDFPKENEVRLNQVGHRRHRQSGSPPAPLPISLE